MQIKSLLRKIFDTAVINNFKSNNKLSSNKNKY